MFSTQFEKMGNVCAGKAFDDRAGCTALVALLGDNLSHSRSPVLLQSRKRSDCVAPGWLRIQWRPTLPSSWKAPCR